jgi:hypothetical protein
MLLLMIDDEMTPCRQLSHLTSLLVENDHVVAVMEELFNVIRLEMTI